VSKNEALLHCPGAETIAALAEGRLDAAQLESVLEHVEHCRTCMDALETANAAWALERPAQSKRTSSAPVWWLAAAAVALLAVSIVAIRDWFGKREPAIENLVALAPRDVRLVEPRLSGGFGYAPYRGPMRASGVTDAERLRLGGAAADAIERAQRDSSSSAQHVAGVAILLADDPMKAVERLRIASDAAPNNAHIANDLAAARYAAALTLDRASLFAEALAAVDRALRIEPRLPEALFNRALILERLGMIPEARRAWEQSLAVDSSSPWADEARRRLAKLPVATSDSQFKRELEHVSVDVVRKFPQQSRTHAESELLGFWAETGAERFLRDARTVGNALAASSGEALLRDAVAAIDHGDSKLLAHAHATYRNGRIAYARLQLDDAERDLRAAARDFETAKSPMAFVARYFVACIHFDRHDSAARGELEALLRELSAHPRYLAIRAQTKWELALCDQIDNDWGAALAQLRDAEQLFAQLGERSNLAFIRSMLATALVSVGRFDDAWTARVRAFGDLSLEGRGNRLAVAISSAARMESRAGRFETARSLLAVEVAEARAARNDFMISDALVRSALASQEDGDRASAEQLAAEALAAAMRVNDRALRERAIADARVADGAARNAIEPLTAAIDFYRDHELATYLPAPYLYRARAWRQRGNDDEAQADLDRGIAAMRDTVLDAGESLYDEAIRLSLDRSDTRRAFAYAERADRNALDELQHKLRGSATTVLRLVALRNEVIAFAVSADDVFVTRTEAQRDELDMECGGHAAALGHGFAAQPRDVATSQSETRDPKRRHGRRTPCFDLLIRPSWPAIARSRELIIVPDARLARVPFAALYDEQRRTYLVEQIAVASAPNTKALEAITDNAQHSVVAVALPTGNERLPASENEPEAITRMYRAGRVIPTESATFRAIRDAATDSDVVHIAGHTARGSDDSALLLAAGERVSWASIAATPLHRRNVFVLAGCETLRENAVPYVRSMSIGGAFLAAGAGWAIGTLTPIADEDAREMFLSIHRELAAGASPAEAVRRVQRDAIASGRLPAWRSIALRTICIGR